MELYWAGSLQLRVSAPCGLVSLQNKELCLQTLGPSHGTNPGIAGEEISGEKASGEEIGGEETSGEEIGGEEIGGENCWGRGGGVRGE